MHPGFDEVVKHPDLMDEVLDGLFPSPSDCERTKFSKVFYNLFPVTKQLNDNMKSFLRDRDSEDGKILRKWNDELVAKIDNMYEDPVCIERKAVRQIYDKLGIDTVEDGVFRFWMFLIKIYQEIRLKCTQPNFHNIFAFMNEFPIHDTRVLIIAKDPSRLCESSGFSIHGSKCPTAENFLDFFNAELKLMDIFCEDGKPMALLKKDLNKKKDEKSNFMGWIKQGVLMVNTMLTLDEKDKNEIESYWLILTHFLIKHISDSYENIVFVLVGGIASDMWNVIDQKKHLIIDVYHPTNFNQTKKNLRWDVQLPFLNTNFFLYQVCRGKDNTKPMIDWTQMSSYDENQNTASVKLTSFFENLLSIANNEPRLQPQHAGKFKKAHLKKIFDISMNTNGYHVVNQIDPDKNAASLQKIKARASKTNCGEHQSSNVDRSGTGPMARGTSTQDKSQEKVDSLKAVEVPDFDKLSLN